MKTLMKKDRNVLPAFRNLLEDFWGADRFFENDWLHFPTAKVPAVNIKSNDGDYEVEVAVPGMRKDDFDVKIDNNILTIACDKSSESIEEDEEGYARREFNYTSFMRSFTLPSDIDPNSIIAKYEEGVLKLSLTKVEAKKPTAKAIEIL